MYSSIRSRRASLSADARRLRSAPRTLRARATALSAIADVVRGSLARELPWIACRFCRSIVTVSPCTYVAKGEGHCFSRSVQYLKSIVLQ